MGTRLALINCKDAYEGPWALSKGNEIGLEIFMLGKGAFVRFECETDGQLCSQDYYVAGEHSLPKKSFQRYRVSKVGASHSGTIVRVQLNGKS